MYKDKKNGQDKYWAVKGQKKYTYYSVLFQITILILKKITSKSIKS
jgi:hypothetical protein